jgi:sulfatase maturation enzyme AslB (radical SAM superfamily)
MNHLSWLPEPSNAEVVRSRLVALVDQEHARRTATSDLKTIYLFLTRKCNLGCQHCYIEGVGPKAKGVDFNLTTIKGLIEQARLHGLRKVKVSGGEPMVQGVHGGDGLPWIDRLERASSGDEWDIV